MKNNTKNLAQEEVIHEDNAVESSAKDLTVENETDMRITSLEEKMKAACRNVKGSRKESSLSVIEKAKSYINDHFQKDISLDEVSKEVNVSPYYFSKLFKEETGQNYIEYMTEIRINKAKELLSQGNETSMKEICISCGYQDPNYFSRIFKKTVGLTPTEYREGVLKS